MEHIGNRPRECSHRGDDRVLYKVFFAESQLPCACQSAAVAIAMANVGASKRCLVDIDDRRRLGHWNKRLRTNAEASKVTLNTSAARMLIDIEQAIISMDDRLEAARQHRALVRDAVDDSRFVPTALFALALYRRAYKVETATVWGGWGAGFSAGFVVVFAELVVTTLVIILSNCTH